MTQLIYLGPTDEIPSERHVAVIAQRDAIGEKGYFFDTADGDSGDRGPFNWRLDESIERAQKLAQERRLSMVVVRAERR